jgi:hypothetical protein
MGRHLCLSTAWQAPVDGDIIPSEQALFDFDEQVVSTDQ